MAARFRLQDAIQSLMRDAMPAAGRTATDGDVSIIGGYKVAGAGPNQGKHYVQGVDRSGRAFHAYRDGSVVYLPAGRPPTGQLGSVLADLQRRPVNKYR